MWSDRTTSLADSSCAADDPTTREVVVARAAPSSPPANTSSLARSLLYLEDEMISCSPSDPCRSPSSVSSYSNTQFNVRLSRCLHSSIICQHAMQDCCVSVINDTSTIPVTRLRCCSKLVRKELQYQQIQISRDQEHRKHDQCCEDTTNDAETLFLDDCTGVWLKLCLNTVYFTCIIIIMISLWWSNPKINDQVHLNLYKSINSNIGQSKVPGQIQNTAIQIKHWQSV